MAQQVNSKMFKNTNTRVNNQKNPKNQWIVLIIIIVLALLSVGVQYIMLDINMAMNKQIEEELNKESSAQTQESQSLSE
ncbi:MAG: hypothetical protein IJB96_07635 [Lachnospira sp.]|nr:hypothetical protein [Lachnospira sp.]